MVKNLGITFCDNFKVDEKWFQKYGVFNPTLDVDTPLFIDPFLLGYSKHPEFSDCGVDTYEAHFERIYRLLKQPDGKSGKLFKAALANFQFSESKGLNGTCIGYSSGSTRGRGWGTKRSKQALEWAKEVIELGVKDPELFSSIALFERGIGCDLISDMITNITLKCIIQFNNRVLDGIKSDLGIKIPRTNFKLGNFHAELPKNPTINEPSPIILLPLDVLKHLPVFDEVSDISAVVQANAELRGKVNDHISSVFKARTHKDKENIKAQAMESAQSFQALLDLLKLLEKTPYNIAQDPDGLIEWNKNAKNFTAMYGLKIVDDKRLDELSRIENVVNQIIYKFQELVEVNGLHKTFYVNHKPRHERYAQMLFYATAAAYCDANNLDISPESDAGAGPVDFKFSVGKKKVIVEIKLSTNSKCVEGYKKQLEAYHKAEKSQIAHYVVIDVGKMGNKWENLKDIAAKDSAFSKTHKIHLIDGSEQLSASKR